MHTHILPGKNACLSADRDPLSLGVLNVIPCCVVRVSGRESAEHKLEKWASHKLVEKNKQIRLASAKKTIEELEKNNP
jgi:hypothetical protein